MLGYDWPRLHAALNDLPAALLVVTVLFDLAAWLTKRESLQAAASWTLWAGVLGGWAAVLAGLQAEDVIEHGDAAHDLMETHETLALVTMGVFSAVLVYKLIRRARLSGVEKAGLRLLSVAGFVGIIWTARIGGKLMFDTRQGSQPRRCKPRLGTARPHTITTRVSERRTSTRTRSTQRPATLPGLRVTPVGGMSADPA